MCPCTVDAYNLETCRVFWRLVGTPLPPGYNIICIHVHVYILTLHAADVVRTYMYTSRQAWLVTTGEHVQCVLTYTLCRVSLILNTVQCNTSGGVAKGGVKEVAIKFDNHQVFTMEELSGVFPHRNQQLAEQRTKTKQKLERQTNSVL